MDTGLIWCLLIGVVGGAFLLNFANSKKPTLSADSSTAENAKGFDADLNMKESLRAVLQFGQTGAYQIETVDEAKNFVVLGSKAGLMTYGHFFPIRLSALEDSKTRIEVGLERRFGFGFDLVGPAEQDRCLQGIRAAVALIEIKTSSA